MNEAVTLPPLPEGFVLDEPKAELPPLPEGFTLDAPVASTALPPLPDGFTLDEPGKVAAAPVPVEEPGFMDKAANIARGIGEQTVDLFGQFGNLIAATAPSDEDGVVRALPSFMYSDKGKPEESLFPTKTELQKASQEMRDFNLGYVPGTTWEQVKENPTAGNILGFALEQGLISTPDMAASVFALPGYVAARTGGLAQDRAVNDGLASARPEDLLKVLPASTATALLDRFGARSMFGLDDVAIQSLKEVPAEVAKAAVKEGATEALQEGVESTATTLGTEAGFDPMKTGDQMLAGAVGGAPVGGAVRTASATVEALSPEPATNNETSLPDEGIEGDAVETAALPSEAPATQDGGEDVASPLRASPPSAISPEERAILRRTSIPDEDIDLMSREEVEAKVAEAIAAGVKVNGAMVRAAEQYRAPQPEPAPETVPIPEARPAEQDQPIDAKAASQKLIQDYQARKARDQQMDAEAEQRVQAVSPQLSTAVLRSVYEDTPRAPLPRPETSAEARPDPKAIAARQIAQYQARSADVDQALAQVQPELEGAVRASVAEDAAEDARIDQALGAPLAATVQRSLYEDTAGDGSRLAPKRVELSEHIDAVVDRVNTEPSEAQKLAGNYAKSHIKVGGLDISIENPKGSTRTGTSPNGQQWSVNMPAHYGYVKRSSGADGDQVDVYVGDNPSSKRVYVIDQKDLRTRRWDEHKAIMGVNSVSEARDLYTRAFSDKMGADRIGGITPMSVSEFKKWLRDGDTTKPLSMGKPDVRLNDQGFPVDRKGKVKKPDSLMEFIARRGGVHEETGELKAMGLTDRKTGFVVGAGPVVRARGMHPDKAREAAAEAGYLPMDSTLADFYDALDLDTRNGRQVFSQYDDDWTAAWRGEQGEEVRQAEQDAAEQGGEQEPEDQSEQLRRAIYARLVAEDYAGTVGDDFSQRVVRYAMAGESFEDAVEFASDEMLQDALAVQGMPDIPEIPFFGDENNEAFAGTASQGSESLEAGDPARDDAGSERETGRAGDDLPVRGEDRSEVEGDGSRQDSERGDRESAPERQEPEQPRLTPPSKVYHGTSSGGFDTFDTYGGEYGLFGSGGYFTEDPSIALEYTRKGRGENPTVYQTSLDVKNPLDMDAPADKAKWREAFDDYLDEQDIRVAVTNQDMYRAVEEFLSGEMLPKWEGSEIMQDGIRSMGHDAITHIGGGRHKASKGVKHRVWIVFDPEQVGKLETVDTRKTETTAEAGADNKPQLVIPGAERATDADMAQRKADAPLKPKAPQKDPGGLFSDEMDQKDLLDFVVNPDQARGTNVPVEMPTDPLFAETVGNTAGAKITDEGLLIDLVRYQKPEQTGATSVRTGVFYLPFGSATTKHYKGGKNGYGGRVEVRGETLIKRPIFVKGATGGKAPEAAYDAIEGKGAYQRMRAAAMKVVMAPKARQEEAGYNFLEEYGADGNLIYEILPASQHGNTLAYALQENVVAHAVREAGYDAVIGHSKAGGKPVIAEVFDVREIDYPTPGETATLHPMFDERGFDAAPSGWETADPGEPAILLSETEQKRVAGIVAKVAGIDPSFMDQIKVPAGSPGLAAWGKSNEDATAAGFYHPVRDVIVLALDTPSVRADKTAYHEAFHRIQNLFVDSRERRVLAAEEPRLRAIVAERGDHSAATVRAMSRREVEAESFGIWAQAMDKGETLKVHIGVRKVWAKIRDVLRRVRNYLLGRGYQSAEDVFAKAKSGEMKERAPRINGQRGKSPELQPAWHGSPYKFDRFSTDHIGKGEGNQAFGWGLYFAQKKDIAEGYRKRLTTSTEWEKDGQPVQFGDFVTDVQTAVRMAARDKGVYPDQVRAIARDIVQTMDEGAGRSAAYVERNYEAPRGYEDLWQAGLKAAKAYRKNKKPGRLFHVDVPEDNELIDWDKPLSKQPDAIKAKIRSAIEPLSEVSYDELVDAGQSFGEIYMGIQDGDVTDREISTALKDAGIPGHRFLDGGSRAAGDGTYNYVIYDDSRVEMLEQFSIAPATDSAAFKKWFGDSKVVDDNGKPLVVYHGGFSDFDQFRKGTNKARNETGIFFAPRPDIASLYAGGDGSNPFDVPNGSVYPVYLSIKNPLTVDFEGGKYGRPEAIKRALDGGYDGVLLKNHFDAGGVQDQWVAFEPTQVKSAISNRGTFDPNDPRIDFSIVERAPNEPIRTPEKARGIRLHDAIAAASKALTSKAKAKGSRFDRSNADDGESFGEYTTRKIVDYLDPVLQMQNKVGVKLNDLADAYLTARLAEGTIRHEIHQIDEKYVTPAIEELAKVGATEKDLHEFMYAMHAPERNRVVGLRNDEDSDLYKAATDPSIKGASGMSTNEAKEIIRELAKDREKFMGIRRASAHIRAMLDDGLKRQLKAGLINKATYERLTTQWQYYVPLRAESDLDGTGGSFPSKSRGFDVRGDEFKGATGRYTKADNVVVYAINNAEQSIIRVEKNKAATAALRFINEFDPQGESIAKVYWSDEPDQLGDITKAPPVYRRKLGKDGKVTNVKVNAFQMKDDVLAAKVGGKTYYMEFADPKVGLALKKMTFPELGVALKIVRKVSNWQSIINTRANPAFVPINFLRDVQTGATLALSKDFSTGEIAKMVGNIPKAWKALWNDARGKPGTGKWDNTLKAFKAAGGKITFDQYDTIEGTAKRLQKDMARITSQGMVGKTWKGFISLIEDLNDTIENGMRLAVFEASRARGETDSRAAFLARDLTVDFQKKGEITPAMNSLYTFFNASVQGNLNFAKGVYRSRKIKVAMAGIMGAGLGQHFWNLAMAGDDDDGENAYLKMLRNEPWKFERSMVFFIPGSKEYVMIPLGFGMNAFWHLGVQGGAVTTGAKDFFPAMLDSTRVAFEAFNPLGSGGWVSMALPSVIDPVWELGTNENFAGNPIYPKENQYDPAPPPKSEQAFKSTSPVFRWGAETLNQLPIISGGTDKLPGRFDVYPDSLEHLWGWFTGGVGRFVSQSVETANRAAALEFEPKKTPFIRSFYGEVDDQGKRSEYYAQREKVQYVKGKMKEFAESGDTDGLKDFTKDNPQEVAAQKAFDLAEKQRRAINKKRRQIEKANPDNAKALLDALDKQELEIMNQARKQYFEAGKKN